MSLGHFTSFSFVSSKTVKFSTLTSFHLVISDCKADTHYGLARGAVTASQILLYITRMLNCTTSGIRTSSVTSGRPGHVNW